MPHPRQADSTPRALCLKWHGHPGLAPQACLRGARKVPPVPGAAPAIGWSERQAASSPLHTACGQACGGCANQQTARRRGRTLSAHGGGGGEQPPGPARRSASLPGHVPAAAPGASPPTGPPSGAASPRCCRVSPRPASKGWCQFSSQLPFPDNTRGTTAAATSRTCCAWTTHPVLSGRHALTPARTSCVAPCVTPGGNSPSRAGDRRDGRWRSTCERRCAPPPQVPHPGAVFRPSLRLLWVSQHRKQEAASTVKSEVHVLPSSSGR